jgi:hypothetical protein
MKAKLKYIFGLMLLIAASCSVQLTEEQKESDSVLLKQTHEYTLNADGSMDYRYYHRRLYNSYLAFHRLYGESFVIYNPEYQTLEVAKSETTMADGKKVQSPSNAFNPVLPFQAADAPAYNHLREMVITHVGLEIGATVELDYTLKTKPGFAPLFSEKLLINESSPIVDMEVIVRVPKGETLNHFVVNQTSGIIFSKKTQGNFDVYRWTAQNVNPLSNEGHQVEGFADYQTLIFSNKNFGDAFETLKGTLTKEFLVDKSMESIVKSGSKGWDLAESIRSYVANGMNTYRVHPKYMGYRFRSPLQVWQANGGNEAEKAILLAALLSEAGFKAEVAMGAYPHFINSEVGIPLAFDKYVVKVELEGETRFLKSTQDETAIPGNRTIISKSDDPTAINLEPTQKATLKMGMKANFELASNGSVSGTATLTCNQGEKEKPLLGGIDANAYKSAILPEGTDAIASSITLGKGFSAEGTGDYFTLTLPHFAQGIALAKIGELPTERITRFELPNAYDESYEFSIKLPKGYVAVGTTHNEYLENEFGSVTISKEMAGSEIKLTRSIKLNQAVVPVNQYSNFRSLMALWADKNLNSLAIKSE